MKSIYLCLFFWACTFLTAEAQIEKGTHFLGATVQGSGYFTKLSSPGHPNARVQQQILSLALQWGMFAKENFMFGVGLSGSLVPYRSWSDASGGSDFKQRISRYGVAPFVRWYKPVFNKLSLFVQPSIGVDWSKTTYSRSATEKSFATRLMVSPGISYRVGKRFAVEADLNIFSLGLSYNKTDTGSSFAFSSHMSSSLPSVFGLRGAFYLN
ncbi:hypothetical protein [Ravibacter arvi]